MESKGPNGFFDRGSHRGFGIGDEPEDSIQISTNLLGICEFHPLNGQFPKHPGMS